MSYYHHQKGNFAQMLTFYMAAHTKCFKRRNNVFKPLEQFVFAVETLCSERWNKVFQTIKNVETDRAHKYNEVCRSRKILNI